MLVTKPNRVKKKKKTEEREQRPGGIKILTPKKML